MYSHLSIRHYYRSYRCTPFILVKQNTLQKQEENEHLFQGNCIKPCFTEKTKGILSMNHMPLGVNRLNRKRSILSFVIVTMVTLHFPKIHATSPSAFMPPIEIFDTSQEKVIANLQNSLNIQLEIKNMLGRLIRRSPQANLEAKNQLMIRVPLEPPIYVQKDSIITGYMSEVIVIINKSGSHSHPNLLLFNEENQPVLIECSFDSGSFLGKIGYKADDPI
ncbi:hypothetical protein SAMN05444416_12133 [Thermoactinomyces sp. DSM 45892]|nr:hypothetical protein SAMN05444416_12133 [Thermoactinomyces sp. DSM 45892]